MTAPGAGQPVDQPTAKPTEKVAAAGLAGAVATLILFAGDLASLEVPPAVAGALATLVAFGAAYLKRNRKSDV